MLKNSRLRNSIQVVFTLFVLYIGLKFVQFVNNYTSGQSPVLSRPAGVEGFLPISALVSLRAWLYTGVFDKIHPAGLVIFLAVLLISFLFKKSFCSWLCPIGTTSEGLAKAGEFFFGRTFHIPKFLDYPLRSLKYILFFFFFSSVFLIMSGPAAVGFINTPYNMIADVKMLQFFQNLSGTALLIVGLLAVLSLLFENFWCRYLCPYGALLGLVSILSPWKISRRRETCIKCGACTRACPNRIAVDKAQRVRSPECTGCLNCVNACPVPDTLRFTTPLAKLYLTPRKAAIAVLGAWLLIIAAAKLSGHWQTEITPQTYQALIPHAADFTH